MNSNIPKGKVTKMVRRVQRVEPSQRIKSLKRSSIDQSSIPPPIRNPSKIPSKQVVQKSINAPDFESNHSKSIEI